MKNLILVILIVNLSSGCASLSERKRLGVGLAIGGTVGAIGGFALSPNSESRSMNALVFGLGGALVGGALSLLTHSEPEVKQSDLTLKQKELDTTQDFKPKEFVVGMDPNLPEFVRTRVRPAVIEEYEERDQIREDGSLSAPHKVYRIKRPVELFPVEKVEVKK